MAWITPAESDLLLAISGAELAALRKAALATGQADPVAPSMYNAAQTVRGYVAACHQNTLGPEGTVPDELLQALADTTVCNIIKRVPGYDISEPRQTARDAATALLKDVAACKFALAQPETAGEETMSGGAPISVVNSVTRNATRANLDSL